MKVIVGGNLKRPWMGNQKWFATLAEAMCFLGSRMQDSGKTARVNSNLHILGPASMGDEDPLIPYYVIHINSR
jgi:hypothetical protein